MQGSLLACGGGVMAKGYIVVDCVASDTYVTFCRCTRKKITKPFSKPDWCPIREMPEKVEE